MDLLKRITDNRTEIFHVFHRLHDLPELALAELETAKYLADALEEAGFEVHRNIGGSTGVVGVLQGREPGPVIALRADMDALPFQIKGEQRNIHACGHDANCTMVLMAARTIAGGGIKKGTLKVIFQPAEETLKGARIMLASGLLKDIDALYGIHLRPIQEAGLGQATPALCHGSSYIVSAKVKGVASHGARPHLGINAVDGAAAIVHGVNAIKLNPTVPYSVKTTKLIAGGTAHNIIPDEAELTFDLRAQTNEEMEKLLEKTQKAIFKGAESIGAEAEITYAGGVPGAEYHQDLVKEAASAITTVLGEVLEPIITPGGEDFHFYHTEGKIKTAYIGLGADLTPGLHHPEMSFVLEALIHGTQILALLIHKGLN
ncbi:MAG: amidohydrolase [Peptococcaceae bacterium]